MSLTTLHDMANEFTTANEGLGPCKHAQDDNDDDNDSSTTESDAYCQMHLAANITNTTYRARHYKGRLQVDKGSMIAHKGMQWPPAPAYIDRCDRPSPQQHHQCWEIHPLSNTHWHPKLPTSCTYNYKKQLIHIHIHIDKKNCTKYPSTPICQT